jgi:hypothetical protein
MKYIFPKTALFLLVSLLIASCDWYDWNPPPPPPPPGHGEATLLINVTTNTGGPTIGPLEGAPIFIIQADGSILARGVSDKEGNVLFKLNAGTYVVDPEEVPGHEDFYEPPDQQTVTLRAGEKQELHLHYDNPIL